MKRDWRIWMLENEWHWVALTGYAYTTKENAEAGLEANVGAADGLRWRRDGDGVVRDWMGNEIAVGHVTVGPGNRVPPFQR